jgi:hypothetical protein
MTLVEALEEALRRARLVREQDIPPVRLARALDAVNRIVLPAIPPEPEHREVEALDGSHVDATELRGFGESEPE